MWINKDCLPLSSSYLCVSPTPDRDNYIIIFFVFFIQLFLLGVAVDHLKSSFIVCIFDLAHSFMKTLLYSSLETSAESVLACATLVAGTWYCIIEQHMWSIWGT